MSKRKVLFLMKMCIRDRAYMERLKGTPREYGIELLTEKYKGFE